MKVVIQSPVEHDGKALAAGDEVDMPKDAAEALVAVGIAEVVIDAKAAKAAAKAAIQWLNQAVDIGDQT